MTTTWSIVDFAMCYIAQVSIHCLYIILNLSNHILKNMEKQARWKYNIFLLLFLQYIIYKERPYFSED
jgi:hypothetical protein